MAAIAPSTTASNVIRSVAHIFQRRGRPRWAVDAVGLILAFAVLGGSTLRAQPAPPAAADVTTADIARWINQLDDDEYETREEATARLRKHENKVIQPLVGGLPGASLEQIIRSVRILTDIATSDGPANQEAQLAILELAERQPTIAGRYAKSALAPISIAARSRSIRQLESKGALPLYRDEDNPATPLIGFRFDESWQGGDADFQLLQLIQDITTLELVGPKVKPSWFRFFAPLTTVHTIKIKDAIIDADAIDAMSRVERLRYLELKFVAVGDSDIPALAKLKQLQILALIGTRITSNGKVDLENLLAGTEVDHRIGGFLGVRGGAHAIGCLVDDVVPDTSAEKAGIRPGDIIVHYNKKRIVDFDSLRDGIAQHPPGESVQVRVLRGDTLQAVHVFQRGDQLGAVLKKHEFGVEIEKMTGRDSFLARRQFRPGDVLVQYHTVLQPTEEQVIAQLKQAETRLAKDRLSTQMMVTALRKPEIVELDVELGRFE